MAKVKVFYRQSINLYYVVYKRKTYICELSKINLKNLEGLERLKSHSCYLLHELRKYDDIFKYIGEFDLDTFGVLYGE